ADTIGHRRRVLRACHAHVAAPATDDLRLDVAGRRPTIDARGLCRTRSSTTCSTGRTLQAALAAGTGLQRLHSEPAVTSTRHGTLAGALRSLASFRIRCRTDALRDGTAVSAGAEDAVDLDVGEHVPAVEQAKLGPSTRAVGDRQVDRSDTGKHRRARSFIP